MSVAMTLVQSMLKVPVKESVTVTTFVVGQRKLLMLGGNVKVVVVGVGTDNVVITCVVSTSVFVISVTFHEPGDPLVQLNGGPWVIAGHGGSITVRVTIVPFGSVTVTCSGGRLRLGSGWNDAGV